jgi:hypothetical protein
MHRIVAVGSTCELLCIGKMREHAHWRVGIADAGIKNFGNGVQRGPLWRD